MPSVRHQLLTHVIPVLRRRSEVHDPAQVRRDVLDAQARARTAPPARTSRAYDVRELPDAGTGFPVHTLTRRVGSDGTAAPQRTVLYLHGGGFVSGLDRFHWRAAGLLADRLDVRVVLPSYPLTPTYSWTDALPPLVRLFERLAVESPQGVVLMGDSAGGGLAVGLAQLVARRPGPQPTHLVALAPWVDLTGDTPGTEEAAAADPWLTLSKLRLYGTWWGAGDPPHPDASPLNGELAGLPPTLVLCGTRDVLLPQSRALVAQARAAGVGATLVEAPGLIHVYPLLPIPEARDAWRRIAAFLVAPGEGGHGAAGTPGPPAPARQDRQG